MAGSCSLPLGASARISRARSISPSARCARERPARAARLVSSSVRIAAKVWAASAAAPSASISSAMPSASSRPALPPDMSMIRSMKALICDGVCAPSKASTGWPATKAKTAGIDWTRNCAAIRWFWSTSILTRRTLPLASFTAFSSAGVRVLQGPHHGAQKSTMTGTSFEASITSAMKVASVPSLIGLTGAERLRSIALSVPRRAPAQSGRPGCGSRWCTPPRPSSAFHRLASFPRTRASDAVALA